MKIIIGHIALLEKDKRQEFTIKVVKQLIDDGYDCHGVFVGKAADLNDEYENSLFQLVNNLQIEDNIHFLGYRKDVPDILTGIDVLIIPASFEGFPLAGLEAAAAGVPVIACDIGGANEFIQVSKAGLTFKFDDYADAAKKAVQVLNDSKYYVSNARSFARQCTIDIYKRNVLNAFSRIEVS